MATPFDLAGKSILITGASSGIGAETACLAGELHARVVLCGRNVERLEATRQRLVGDNHQVFPFDVAGFAAGETLVAQVSAEFGPLAGVVHCAGVMLNRPLRFLSESDLQGVMAVNHAAAMGIVKGYRKKGACQPEGSLVLVASVMGLVGQPGLSAYCASKGALIATAKALAIELARERIRVNCVTPAMVQGELMDRHFGGLNQDQMNAIRAMHPLGFGTPRDVAAGIVFLLSDAARWITGTHLVIDGGYTAQ
jgi:NAD(P)-dependent dehydrogenase (short-subunit alcohol dehydrogenase family)